MKTVKTKKLKQVVVNISDRLVWKNCLARHPELSQKEVAFAVVFSLSQFLESSGICSNRREFWLSLKQ